MEICEKKVTKEELVKQFRTGEIIAAGRQVLLDEGYNNITLERVAEVAGISKGTIYLYFKNKGDLLVSIVHDLATESIDRVAGDLENIDGAFNKIRFMVDSFINDHLNNHREIIQVFVAEVNLFKMGVENVQIGKMKQVRAKILDLIQSIIERGKREGCVRDINVKDAALFLLHILEGYRLHYLIENIEEDLGRVCESISDFYIQGIKK